MRRAAIFAVFLLALAGGAAWYMGILGDPMFRVDVALTLYDTNASGNADLVRERIAEQATIWRWDRDDDGIGDVVAYDVSVNLDGQLSAGGAITAWDFGADGILDGGQVPPSLQDLMRSPQYLTALQEAEPGNVELVDASLRAFVDALRTGYDEWRLSGFQLPILGAKLPDADRLLPGARRAYRRGIHQGFDMYPGHVGVPTGYGAPVIAVKRGTIVRADTDYVEITAEKYAAAITISLEAGTTPEAQLDQLRGRQVWIDHGDGIISRYAHLSSVAPGIVMGGNVDAGKVIAFVGNSGMEPASRGGNDGAHLHFELRIDGKYLGEGMSPDEIRRVAGPLLGAAE